MDPKLLDYQKYVSQTLFCIYKFSSRKEELNKLYAMICECSTVDLANQIADLINFELDFLRKDEFLFSEYRKYVDNSDMDSFIRSEKLNSIL